MHKKISLQKLLPFEVRQHSHQQLNLQYKTCWNLDKIVCVAFFSPPYLPHTHTSIPTIHIIKPFLHFSQFSHPYFTSLLVHKTISTISITHSFITHSFFTTSFSHTVIPTTPQQKSFPLPQPFSRFMQWQGPSEEGSIVRTDTVIIFPCSPKAMKQHSQSLFLCCSNKEYWSITGCTIW